VQATAVAIAILAAALGLAIWGRDPLLSLVGLLVLFLSLSRYFLPTRYTVGDEGVEVATLLGRSQRRWSGLRRASADPRGITLSPYTRQSWLDPYRSVRLLYHRNRDQVLAAVAEHLEPADGTGDAPGVAPGMAAR
jgi:hypothetical protein